jgi:hypothetical protein
MIEVLKALKGRLIGDPTLAGLISDVYMRPVPKKTPSGGPVSMPYIVHAGEEVGGGHSISREFLYRVDIYDRSRSVDKASRIADRVNVLLKDGQPLTIPGRSGARSFYDFGPEPVEEPADDPDGPVQHLHMEFMIRYTLDALAGAS